MNATINTWERQRGERERKGKGGERVEKEGTGVQRPGREGRGGARWRWAV